MMVLVVNGKLTARSSLQGPCLSAFRRWMCRRSTSTVRCGTQLPEQVSSRASFLLGSFCPFEGPMEEFSGQGFLTIGPLSMGLPCSFWQLVRSSFPSHASQKPGSERRYCFERESQEAAATSPSPYTAFRENTFTHPLVTIRHVSVRRNLALPALRKLGLTGSAWHFFGERGPSE